MARAGRWEVQMAGVGGQGLALAGLVLAEAAGVHEGKNVVMTETHGVNVRGGPSRSEVIISEEEIDYLAVSQPDVLLAMTPQAAQSYASALRGEGILILDSSPEGEVPSLPARAYTLPLTHLAQEELGEAMVANMVALGALAALTGVVSLEALEKAVRSRMTPQARELNLNALLVGWEVGVKAGGERGPAERKTG